MLAPGSETPLFSRTDRSVLGRWWWTVDRSLLAIFIALILIGVMLVATASPPVAERIGYDPYHFLVRHGIMAFPALILLVVTSMLSPRMIWRGASIIFTGGVLLMAGVLMTGAEVKGAQRWVTLPFGFSLQPSEFVKPAFAVCAAWFMAMQKTRENVPGYLISTGLYVLVVALLLLQPDFGMTFVVTVIWAAQIFLVGLPFRYLVFMIAALAIGVFAIYMTLDHVSSRVDRFLNPESGDNYQVERSIEAFQNGGLMGTGLGQGTVKLYLPDAHADFIFSAAAEEMGLIFTLGLIAIYAFVMLRALNRLMESEDMFAVLAAGGLLAMFGLQALIHMGSALNILPAKGMTLPFISYGGSSLLAMGLSMGAVLGLTRRQSRSGISRGGLSLQTGSSHVHDLE